MGGPVLRSSLVLAGNGRPQGRMIEGMAQVHMTQAEVTNDFAAVIEKLKEGAEVVVEQDHRPVAIIRQPKRSGRSISECIASAKASGSKVTLDGGFAADVEEGMRSRGASAIEQGYAVATRNARHFHLIPGLVLQSS